jgi:hypothetical protein
MSRVCDDCGVETKRFAQCSNGQRTWYRCVDNGECEVRTKKLLEQKEVEAQEKQHQDFKAKHGFAFQDLITVGVIYKDATTYFYHKPTDTLYGKWLGRDDHFFRRDKPINLYERAIIDEVMKK